MASLTLEKVPLELIDRLQAEAQRSRRSVSRPDRAASSEPRDRAPRPLRMTVLMRRGGGQRFERARAGFCCATRIRVDQSWIS